jgi:hypothetical protein
MLRNRKAKSFRRLNTRLCSANAHMECRPLLLYGNGYAGRVLQDVFAVTDVFCAAGTGYPG